MNVRTALAVFFCSLAVIAVALAGFVLGSTVSTRAQAIDTAGSAPLCLNSAAAASPTFASEMTKANERMHSGMAVAPTGDPDRDFARMMIPHHQGAIDMALVELKYGRDKTLRRLAQAIVAEQGQEIAYMRALLAKPDGDAAVAASSTSN